MLRPFQTYYNRQQQQQQSKATTMFAASKKRLSELKAPAAKRFKSNFDNTFLVLVGPMEVRFTIHKETASAKSPFFEAACSERWSAGRDGAVRLPDYSAKIFEVVVTWLYSDKLIFTPPSDANTQDHPEQEDLVSLWILAHYLGCVSLCNQVVDVALECMRREPAKTANEERFSELPPGSGFWRLLVDHLISASSPDFFDAEYAGKLPVDVLENMVKKFLGGRRKFRHDPLERAPCYYHDHPEGKDCLDQEIRKSA